MSVTQTVEVPDSHRLTIDVPSEIPAGPVILTFTPKRAAPKESAPLDILLNEIWELCKDSTVTVNSFREERRRERDIEEKRYRERFHKTEAGE